MKKNIQYLLPVLLLIFQICGCAVTTCPEYKKNGKTYGWKEGSFRAQWDDYYLCALSYTEGEFHKEALWALDEAVKRRNRDQRRARTYGMHVIDDYFPHREKGIVYYLRGDYDKAKQELELSVSQEESAKAFHFLDKVRKSILIHDKHIVSDPKIIIDTPAFVTSNVIRTRSDPVVISGRAEDNLFVSEVILEKKPVFMKVSAQKVKFRRHLSLGQGMYETEISARNLLGGMSVRKIIIHVDRSGPVAVITKFGSDTGIQGYLYDESGIRSLTIDGKPIPVQKGKDVYFHTSIKPGIKDLTILASDELGNQTQGIISKDTLFRHLYSMLTAQKPLKIISDTGEISQIRNTLPEITLEGWPDGTTVFLDKVSIRGQVASQNIIKSLTVNNKPLLHHAGHIILFSRSLELVPGKNTVRFEAKDTFGNTTAKEITIIRKIPEILKPRYRFHLAMHPFEHTDPASETSVFDTYLIKSLKDRDRFQISVREKSAISSEKPGQLPNSLVLGNINETAGGIEVVARVIDMKTSELIAVKDAFSTVKGRFGFERMAKGLAEKFHAEFPLVRGTVTDISGKWKFWRSCPKFSAYFGEGSVKKRWPLIVYQEENPKYNHVTGESLGSDTKIIGYNCVDGICDILAEKLKPSLGDKVFTQ
ncbi:MAG: hypothetical protein GY795_12505 [Desulfobacterales bacterium]|nr:hypothetical protein [Desulfobacterales bacterium]